MTNRSLRVSVLSKFLGVGAISALDTTPDASTGAMGIGQVCSQPLVKIVTTQKIITGGGKHINHAIIEFNDRNIKGAAT